jgi:hypothetical protein
MRRADARAAVGRTHRRHQRPAVNRPGNSGLLPGDDLSNPREGPPGRCVDGTADVAAVRSIVP